MNNSDQNKQTTQSPNLVQLTDEHTNKSYSFFLFQLILVINLI